MFSRVPAKLALSVFLSGACAHEEPEQKKAPVVDEFQGFAALRGEPREKKKPKEEPKPEEGGGAEEQAGKGEQGTALTKEQVLGAIATAQKRVDACLKKHHDPGMYLLRITIGPDGTSAVEPQRAPTRKEEPELWAEIEAGIDGGKNVKSPTSRCLAAAFTQIKYPSFEGKPLEVTYPLLLR